MLEEIFFIIFFGDFITLFNFMGLFVYVYKPKCIIEKLYSMCFLSLNQSKKFVEDFLIIDSRKLRLILRDKFL